MIKTEYNSTVNSTKKSNNTVTIIKEGMCSIENSDVDLMDQESIYSDDNLTNDCEMKLEKAISFSESVISEEDYGLGCDLCHESAYKCYQCRKESISSVVFNSSVVFGNDMKNDIVSQASLDGLSNRQGRGVETDSHLLVSFEGNNEGCAFKKEILENREIRGFDEGEGFSFPI